MLAYRCRRHQTNGLVTGLHHPVQRARASAVAGWLTRGWGVGRNKWAVQFLPTGTVRQDRLIGDLVNETTLISIAEKSDAEPGRITFFFPVVGPLPRRCLSMSAGGFTIIFEKVPFIQRNNGGHHVFDIEGSAWAKSAAIRLMSGDIDGRHRCLALFPPQLAKSVSPAFR